jgi:hypothetical protein
MSEVESPAETEEDVVALEGEVTVSRCPGRDPVTVVTTRVPGEEPTREERIRAGLRRLAHEGRITLPG